MLWLVTVSIITVCAMTTWQFMARLHIAGSLWWILYTVFVCLSVSDSYHGDILPNNTGIILARCYQTVIVYQWVGGICPDQEDVSAKRAITALSDPLLSSQESACRMNSAIIYLIKISVKQGQVVLQVCRQFYNLYIYSVPCHIC